MAFRVAALLVFAGLAGLFPDGRAGAQADFAAVTMREIDAVVRFDPPEFAIGPGREAPFGFYGKAMNEFEKVNCERSAPFGIVAKANLAGEIRAGICVREAKRVRALAASAQPKLAGMIAMLAQDGAKFDPALLEKFGWNYARTAGADGSEEHYFPLIAVGHGIGSLPTLVRVPAGAGRAIIVQADTMKLCENYGLREKTLLCSNTRQALTEIARRLDARFGR